MNSKQDVFLNTDLDPIADTKTPKLLRVPVL